MIAFGQHHVPKLQSVSSFLFYSHPFLWQSLADPETLVATPLHPARVRNGNFVFQLLL